MEKIPFTEIGLEKLKKLRAIYQESSIEIPGAPQKLSVIRSKMVPNKVLEKQTMGSMTISKTNIALGTMP